MSKKKRNSHEYETDAQEVDLGSAGQPKRRMRAIAPAAGFMLIIVVVALWVSWKADPVTSFEPPTAVAKSATGTANDNPAPVHTTGGPSIYFPEPSHDFGAIIQGDKVSHTFIVQNYGDRPLKLIKAKGSWGCTAAVLTETDIPPGGEGKIEVSFDSGHKIGKQNKTITVTSNDPRKATTKLQIAVVVEVEFSFSPTSVGFGKVYQDQTVTKSAKILIKNPDRTQVDHLKTSSEYVQARIIDQSSDDAPGTVPLEITIAAGLPPGRINEFVTAIPTNASLAETKLRISGKIVGQVEVTPDVISFMIQPGDSGGVVPAPRGLTIDNHSKERPLKILDVKDPDDRLILDLETVQEGQQYRLTVRLKGVPKSSMTVSGSIVISTDNPDQSSVPVRYSIYKKK